MYGLEVSQLILNLFTNHSYYMVEYMVINYVLLHEFFLKYFMFHQMILKMFLCNLFLKFKKSCLKK